MTTVSGTTNFCKQHPENIEFLLEVMKDCLTNEYISVGSTALLASVYDCPCTRTALGVALNALNHFSEALKAFDDALALNEASAEAHQGRGVALLHSGEHAKALVVFTKVIELKNNYREAYQGLGMACLNLGLTKRALKAFAKVEKTEPGPAGSWPKLRVQNRVRQSTCLLDRLEAASRKDTDQTSTKRKREDLHD